MSILKDYEPKDVLAWFEAICAIPHGSGHVATISNFLVDFAKARNLAVEQDKFSNVVIRKPATAGMENSPVVILQGHMDMVCEKDPDCAIDFAKDGLKLVTDGVKVWADGTTLGGDNGVAVAYCLAILDSDTVAHPALEVVFTSDEETGMVGASGLDGAKLEGRLLLNLDSDEAGVLTAGCAGGANATITLPVQAAPAKGKLFQLDVGGLRGGHSGIDAGKGRGNANKILAEALLFLANLVPFRLCYLEGGAQGNAIARNARALFVAEERYAQSIFRGITALELELQDRFVENDDKVFLHCQYSNKGVAKVWSGESTVQVLKLLLEVPDGVQSMSRSMPHMVETSLNLGVVKMVGDAVKLSFCLRSSVNRDCDYLAVALESIAQTYGAIFNTNGRYGAWEYQENSPLRDRILEVYQTVFGQPMKVETVHAGLECGIFCDKLPGLDAVSFGPNLEHIHSPQETFSIQSVAETYKLLLEILKAL